MLAAAKTCESRSASFGIASNKAMSSANLRPAAASFAALWNSVLASCRTALATLHASKYKQGQSNNKGWCEY